MPLFVWILAAAVTAGAAMVQGTVGVGFAMVSVPILALLDPALAPAPQILIAVPLTVAMMIRERDAMDLSGVWWIIIGRLPGAFVGVLLLGLASARLLDALIGLIVLGAVITIATGYHLTRTRTTEFLAGMASGTTGVVGSIGGPPVALIYTGDESDTIRSTLAAVFTFGALTSIAFRLAGGHLSLNDLKVALVLLPAAGAGLWVATLTRDRVPRRVVRAAILVVCAVAATTLLLRAVL
ncbi:MAG: sulfite exporter TauE/SafE family protein [Acidimicrobiia bacterium]|nr:sulfite exporter TauE/SafE family protein [Acidimicrobiia bacterium]